MRASKIFLAILPALLLASAAHAVETHTKLWTAAVFTGPMSSNKNIKYYIEPDVRFIDNKYKFQQALVWMALGYQVTPRLILYAGDAPVTSRESDGTYDRENVVWQQASYTVFNSPFTKFVSRSRMEEIKNNHEGAWAMKLRQRFQFKFPLKNWVGRSLVVSDEVYFNLKHPDWESSNRFISQNRAYVGVTTAVTKEISFSVGYLNQYLFQQTDQMSNVLQVATEVNFG